MLGIKVEGGAIGGMEGGAMEGGAMGGGAAGGGATGGALGPGPGPTGPPHHPASAGWHTTTVNAMLATSCTREWKLSFFMAPSSTGSDIGASRFVGQPTRHPGSWPQAAAAGV
jgi:hypothetical protein